MNHTFKIVFSLFSLLAFVANTYAQPGCGSPNTFCMSNASINACGGTIYDAGGTGNYPETGYTMTICPDTPGDVVQISFSVFQLQTSPNPNNSDYLTIYDGPNASSPSLGNYTGNDLEGLLATATIFNASGCLTLVFDPNGSANTTNPGFVATIDCTTPCDPPVSGSQILAPAEDALNIVNICPGDEVTFGDDGSEAQPGFNLVNYRWNFGDGEIGVTTAPSINHTFNEPGAYVVTLVVEDDNGCQSSNFSALQVFVSTIPVFSDLQSQETTICAGETLPVDAGNFELTTWTSLPPTVYAEPAYLADDAGATYTTSIFYDFFEDGAVLDDCSNTAGGANDLLGIFINMEHSYMGDLIIQITCPDGTSVFLTDNVGTNTFLGQANDGDEFAATGPIPGVGMDYTWSSTATNGTWGDNSGTFQTSYTGTDGNAYNNVTYLPPGTYEAQGNLCDLIGCPLNGTWTISVTDDQGADDGNIFYWGLDFDPYLFPDVTTFTPTVGAGADSSYWTGPNIVGLTPDGDSFIIETTTPGSYDYTYTVINNFGCQFDTTITITINSIPEFTAGPDLDYGCVPLQFEGGYVDTPTPVCTVSTGQYTYCYNDGENYEVTYCPDNPGDGFSFVEIEFIQGQTENFFDEFFVYDGQNTSAPPLAGFTWPMFGDLTGQIFTATNTSGCLTMQVTPDGSVSCGSGSFTEWIYNVGCGDPNDFVWEWTPAANLDNPSSPTPTLSDLEGTTTFTLTAYPAGHPLCAVTDEMIVSSIQVIDIDLENLYQTCEGTTVNLSAPTVVTGIAPYTISWTETNGGPIAGTSPNVTVDTPTEYCVTVTDNCGSQVTECVLVDIFPAIPATFSLDTLLGCEPLATQFQSDYTAFQDIADMVWQFGDGDSSTTIGSAGHMYTADGAYYPSLFIRDINGCEYFYEMETPVLVWNRPLSSFTVDPEHAILPNSTISFFNQSPNGTAYEWIFDTVGTSNAEDTVFTFPPGVAGEYVVYNIASNEFGCTDTSFKKVFVDEAIDIYIPNCFTPDGDGVNDVWRVEGAGFRDVGFDLQIYNKWGDLIFTSNDPYKAWTGGTDSETYFVPDGVYLYRLKIRDIQNNVNHVYEGHIVLIRG